MRNSYRQPGGRPHRPQPSRPGGVGERTVPLRQQAHGAVPAGPGPAGWPQPGWGPPPRRKRRSVAMWVLGAVVVVLVAAWVGALGFIWPGWFVHTVFDAGDVQLGVQHVLRDEYHIAGVESVTCPPGEPVQAAQTFACQVSISDRTQVVTVTVTDADGTYEVSRPR